MKNYLILVILLLTGLYYYNSLEKKEPKTLVDSKVQNKQVRKKNIEFRKQATMAKKKLSDTNILFSLLKPPKDEELESVWIDEYGCFEIASPNNEQLEGFVDELNHPQESCKYKFLNAKTFKEAVWMKNNGYPTKSMLDLVKNPDFEEQLAEMVKNKYPVALAVASINAIERGDYKEASSLALSNRAYSDKSMTYPHVLYGEALLADNMQIAAVSQFFAAGILGDPWANSRALQLSPDKSYAVTALSTAQNYLKNVFGIDIPNDPRPMGDDD